MNVATQDKITKLYEEVRNQVYTSLLAKHEPQTLIIDIQSGTLCNDKYGNHHHNIRYKAKAELITFKNDIIKDLNEIEFIAPVKTWIKCFKKKCIDIRLHDYLRVVFKVRSQKEYVLLRCAVWNDLGKCEDDVLEGEKEEVNEDDKL